MIIQIKTISDVEVFSHQLVREGLTGGFHPDDPFEDYSHANGKPLYSPEEAVQRNSLMAQCFDVCGDDIYEVMGRITLKDTPSESIFDDDHEHKQAEFAKLVELGVKEYKPNSIGNTAVREIVQARHN